MEMIEQVARAIHRSLDEPMPRFVQQKWEDLTDLAREAMLKRARAAVEAMREPTPHVEQAGKEMLAVCLKGECPRAERHVWKTMIQAALTPDRDKGAK